MEMEKEINLNSGTPGNSRVVQLLGLCAFTAEDAGSIPGQGIKISKLHGSAKKKKTTGDICITKGGRWWKSMLTMPNESGALPNIHQFSS